MNSKSTWIWGIVAVSLFAFIFLFERHIQKTPTGPEKVLADLHARKITGISVTPAGQPAIHVDRTNNTWQLTQPLSYPAQATNVDAFLEALKNLTTYPPITPAELRKRPKADEEFGFVSPQATATLFKGDETVQILFGNRTVPGDQVFLRVVGIENIFIVDAGLLNLLPHTVDDWRDRTFVNLAILDFDRLTITNGANGFELRRDATNAPWRIIYPMKARADNEKTAALLAQLSVMRVNQFASDNARADLDNFGLQPPDLELNFSESTNTVLNLQFGKNPTNDAGELFARRDSGDNILVVSNGPVATWRTAFDDLRDRHLLSVGTAIDSLEIHADDNFTLTPDANGAWEVMPQNYLADSNFMAYLLVNLTTMQVTQFVKDVVIDTNAYGLATPSQQLLIHTHSDLTNSLVIQLNFGTTNADQVYVKRSDEDSVYALPAVDLQLLPSASWQMRDRQVWNFNAVDVTNIVVHQGTRERQITRTGPHSWALAAGSQGVINDLAIDELTPRFGALTAAVWTGRGVTNLAQYGFNENDQHVTFQLKSGDQYTVEFGGAAPSQFPYAVVTLSGEPWVFEFPWDLYQLTLVYFSIPNVIP